MFSSSIFAIKSLRVLHVCPIPDPGMLPYPLGNFILRVRANAANSKLRGIAASSAIGILKKWFPRCLCMDQGITLPGKRGCSPRCCITENILRLDVKTWLFLLPLSPYSTCDPREVISHLWDRYPGILYKN